MQKIRFALDLTWVRHKIVGGTEAFVNNLIVGFSQTDKDFQLVLITAKDNAALFEKYLSDRRITMEIANVQSASVAKRIIWQNLHMSHFMLQRDVHLCLEPVYAKPLLCSRKIKWLTVIHDLEALHFPENHSWATNRWLRLSWRNSAKKSEHVISISDFVKDDIQRRYNVPNGRITTIHNPIEIDTDNQVPFADISTLYGVKDKQYYYTVSKLNPHKNLVTLVRVFGEIKKREIQGLPCKLLISGVNGGMESKLKEEAQIYGLTDELILTGFVDDDVRNSLYAHAKAFLFPSIFEGFGMPPIEAICCGTPVITTTCTCIPEITQNMANYVDDPYSVDNWIEVMKDAINGNSEFDASVYHPKCIALEYLKILSTILNT